LGLEISGSSGPRSKNTFTPATWKRRDHASRMKDRLLSRPYSKPAVLPARYQFHRVFDQRLMDVFALGAFKGPQIGSGRTRIDTSQYHAPALTLRTAGTLNRKERWFGAGIRLRHVMASLVWFR
jgi:hypothetical protein